MKVLSPTLCRSAARAASSALLGLACLVIASSLVACSSSGERQPGDDLGLTKKEKEGLFLENALRYLDMGEIDRAQAQARKGLEIDPGNERFLLIFGRCSLRRGNSQDIQVALDTFKRIGNQEDYRVQMSIGAATERLGMFYDEAATGVLDGTRTTEADDPAARAAELSESAREYWEKAHSHFKRSLELRSGTAEAINGLARTSALLGRTAESLSYSRELIQSIKSTQRLVGVQLEDDELTAMEESRLFRDRTSNRDFEVKTRLHIVELLRGEDKLTEAIEELNEVIALDPDLAQAHSQKAQLLYESGDFVKARAAVTRFIKMRAPTSKVTDPEIKRAFELRERCDRQLVGSQNG